MTRVECKGDTGHEKLRTLGLEGILFDQMVPKIASRKIVKADHEIVIILKGILNIYQEL